MPTDTIVSLIIVTHNDEENIVPAVQDVNRVIKKIKINWEILIVDNCSNDSTIEKLKNLSTAIPFLRTLVLSKEYENDIALTAGLDNCVGDFAILFNIHIDPPETLPVLLETHFKGWDVVLGKPSREIIKITPPAKFLIRILEKISTQGFQYRPNYLISLTRKAINSVTRTRRKSRDLNYINNLIGLKKTTISYVPLKSAKDYVRKTSFFSVLFSSADIIVSNSFRPIRFLSASGMLASVLFLIYIAGVVVLQLVFKLNVAPKGWISLATVMGAMFFLLFSLLTLIGEYIVRILAETRNEPFYFISEEFDKSVIIPKGRKKLNIE